MARKHIGRLSLGTVTALCTLLLLVPQARSQNLRVTVKKFVISGSVGVPGVTMQGLTGPAGPVTTDENGVYTAEVNYGWSGKVTPVKVGYTFVPADKTYAKVTENMTSEDYTGKLLTFTISGSVGLPGVRMTGLGDPAPVSDEKGNYTATVSFGWSGQVMPEKMGYRFEPSVKQYSAVAKNEKLDYKSYELTFTISGNAGDEGVKMTGLPGDPVSKKDRSYSAKVGYGWNGKVTPEKEGREFNPPSVEYPPVTADMPNQDYTARVFMYEISGSTGMPDVVLKGFPVDTITNTDGFYSVEVPHGWNGTITPEKSGYNFDPQSRPYTKVVAKLDNQNYAGTVIMLAISGRTSIPNVTLEGLPGDPSSDATGLYTAKVEYGWTNIVTPVKEGFQFDPPSKEYSAITQDQKQDYKATPVTFKITGSVEQAGVVLQVQGLPTSATSGADGSYTIEVPYKWSGSVTPRKAGYQFEPGKNDYTEVLSDMPSQDYQANIIMYTISGKVTGEAGPLTDLTIAAESPAGFESATTDAKGEFQLDVGYGWRGRITPQGEAYTFSPSLKPIETVTQNVANVNFTARTKMLTITGVLKFENTALADVSVTGDPGDHKTTTDKSGKYTLTVPYGWSGQLRFEKPGFDITIDDMTPFTFTDLRESVDRTVAPKPTPPPVETTAKPGPPTPGPGPTPPVGPQPTPEAAANAQAIQQQLTTYKSQAYELLQQGKPVTPQLQQQITKLEQDLAALQAGTPTPTAAQTPGTPPVPPLRPALYQTTNQQTMLGANLIDVLTAIAERTGAQIMIDGTVKREAVSVPFDVSSVSDPVMALQMLLQGTPQYRWKSVAKNTYIVYKPITNSYQGEQLRQALQELSIVAEVPIIPDPNVTGQVWAEIRDQPLEKALEIMVAGTPYVVERKPDYYLVADRGVRGPAFQDISVTRMVRTNFISPEKVKSLISPAYSPYVMAEPIDARDPNRQARLVTITAPPSIAERIVASIRELDLRPRLVLLDARVVTLERGDLLNLGVEWGFPTIRAGAFYDSTLKNNTDFGQSLMTGIQIGYNPTREFTDSLMMAINLLRENSQADIVSSPQLLAEDGRQSQLKVITEEWFMMTANMNQAFFFTQSELQKIESGTVLSITPHINDHNDITLEMAVEVSDSIPSGRGTGLPVVTRRQARNIVTVEDGGTVALAGLTESRSRSKESSVPGLSKLPLVGGLFKNNDKDKMNREVAVFVTARLVHDAQEVAMRTPTSAETRVRLPSAAAQGNGLTREDLREALARQSQ
jgi:hypothetical protein